MVREAVEKGGEGGARTVSKDPLLNLLTRLTGVDVGEIHEESLLVTDLGLTSIDRLELVNLLEQEFRLDMDDSQIGPETRLSDLRRIIAKREKPAGNDHFRFWTNARFFRWMRFVWDGMFHGPLFHRFVTLEVRGVEHLHEVEGPVIFVANHLSYLDQPAVMFALPPKLRARTATAAWEEFFFDNYSGFKGLLRRLSYEYGSVLFNLFPLPQSQGFRNSLKFMGRLADAGVNILIFPEGGHSLNGCLQPFHPGVGIMVKDLGIPVVPIKISGTENVLPHEVRWPKQGVVTVTFGAPLMFRYEEPAEIVATVRHAVESINNLAVAHQDNEIFSDTLIL